MAVILIVEDDELVRATLQEMLDELRHHTLPVGNFTSARSLLMRSKPDAVLSNIVLPDGNGFEVCRAARAWAVPCGLITGSPTLAERLTDTGARFLPKPFTTAQLDDFLSSLLSEAPPSQA